MRAQAPKIDPRSYEDVVQKTEALVEGAGLGWIPGDPDAASALIRVFGRMVQHLVERLNQVPEKHFAAFLNLLGAEPRPPEAAQVPLTFHLVDSAPADSLVPAGTQVAAKALEGDAGEVLFETTLDLVVTRARLSSFFVHNPVADFYADRSPEGVDPCPIFEVDRPIEHSVYVDGGSLFTLPAGTSMKASLVALDTVKWNALPVAWEHWDGQAWQPLPDTTPSASDQGVSFTAPAAFVPFIVDGVEARWIRIRLTSTLSSNGLVPVIKNIALSAVATRTGLFAEALFAGSFPIDQSLDFQPFGAQPRTNDTFYLASNEVFAREGAHVKVVVKRSDQADPLIVSDNPIIAWEVWNGAEWLEVGRSSKSLVTLHANPPQDPYELEDGTKAFTQDGTVKIKLPGAMGPLAVRGTTSHWMRARVVDGHYGGGVTLTKTAGTNVVTGLKDDGYRPPSLESVKLEYTYTPSLSEPRVGTLNDFAFVDWKSANANVGFVPFRRSLEEDPAVYLGFDRPFDNVSATLFVDVAPPLPSELQLGGAPGDLPKIVWEYSGPGNGEWLPLGAEDRTRTFNQSGLVRFIGPVDLSRRRELGQDRYWLRARLAEGEFSVIPRLRCIRTNTTWADQVATVRGETLGSSTGEKSQVFTLSLTPVLSGQQIEALEPGLPSAEEQRALTLLEGEGAVTAVLDEHGHVKGAWVRWHAVPDFYGSGPRDRHYTLDSVTGQVRFGDGQRGMIPPKGSSSLRAPVYRTGGGAQGNRPAGNVTELKTAVPYVDGAGNMVASSGGADREELERVKERGPRILRHGYMAVTADDFEDLTREASTAVAKVKALTPEFDPIEQADPDSASLVPDAGEVFLLLVPRGTERRPTAGLGLLKDVETYLLARCAPAVKLKLGGPDWVDVKVDVIVAPRAPEGADELRAAVTAAIERYLHPLTGGLDGKGWSFGDVPHESDLYPVIDSIAGVDHVRKLALEYRRAPLSASSEELSDASWPLFVEEEAEAAGELGRVLIFSGLHKVLIDSPEES